MGLYVDVSIFYGAKIKVSVNSENEEADDSNDGECVLERKFHKIAKKLSLSSDLQFIFQNHGYQCDYVLIGVKVKQIVDTKSGHNQKLFSNLSISSLALINQEAKAKYENDIRTMVNTLFELLPRFSLDSKFEEVPEYDLQLIIVSDID